MSRQTQAILTMLLLLIVFSTTFAVDQAVTDDRAWNSPVFLRHQEIQTVQNSDLSDLGFPSSRLSPDRKSLELRNRLTIDAAQDEVTNDGEYEYFYIDKPEGWVHPGKAVLLSALIPGAGELYAGSYWKSALFFAVEVGCWAAAINYGIRGEDKDTEFKKYADSNWNAESYRSYEYWLANNYYTNDTTRDTWAQTVDPADNTPENWESLSWSERMRYLPEWFTHELPDEKTQQYYEMIGKYLEQFGVGWPGEWDNPLNYGNGQFDPLSYFTSVGDVHWYAGNLFAKTYSDMRHESNSLLETRDNFFKIVMINHVLSAFDAGFTVSRHNRKLVEGVIGAETKLHNGEVVPVGTLSLRW